MANNKKSQYTPIWEKLKKDGECKISAHPALHPRIIKAVIKRKYEDIAYKLELSENCQRARITYTAENSMILFKLHKSLGLGDL